MDGWPHFALLPHFAGRFREPAALETARISSPRIPRAAKMFVMEIISRHVDELRPHERSAAELLLGHRLRGHERLIMQVVEVPAELDMRPTQTLEDWAHVYEGLTEEEIEAIDAIAKTRAVLTRDVPT